ncbi:hypothetical protein MKW94_002689 [Papaver nudicaule]|uniref:Uncharacterized protein n=1 Tax=Papaver nudicaule TaxID=74823 RepID=A0AA41VJE6_PAPNU|nr:hypothetical protein [Papaver nudicaule]
MTTKNPSKTLTNLLRFHSTSSSSSTQSQKLIVKIKEFSDSSSPAKVNRSSHIDKKSREQFEMRIMIHQSITK